MTDNLTEELARLNEVAKRGTIQDDEYGETISLEFCKAAPDAITLLNTMHGLLVQVKVALHEALAEYDITEGTIYESIPQMRQALAAIRDAGIGGRNDQ